MNRFDSAKVAQAGANAQIIISGSPSTLLSNHSRYFQ